MRLCLGALGRVSGQVDGAIAACGWHSTTKRLISAPHLSLGTLLSRSLVTKPSPVALAKGIKNEPELEGMRAAHVRDGVAMVLALSRLERDVAAGDVITEVDVDERTTAERARQEKFVGTCIFLPAE